jgi:hypothetical protein
VQSDISRKVISIPSVSVSASSSESCALPYCRAKTALTRHMLVSCPEVRANAISDEAVP